MKDAAPPEPNLEGITVLLIDDDDDGREMVQRILEGNRAKVIACPSAAKAFEALDVRIPTVIVCDLSMPEKDGLSFLAEFRVWEGRRGIRCVPALALTGIDVSVAMKDAARAGYQLYLQKPIEPEVFLRSVARLAVESPR